MSNPRTIVALARLAPDYRYIGRYLRNALIAFLNRLLMGADAVAAVDAAAVGWLPTEVIAADEAADGWHASAEPEIYIVVAPGSRLPP